MRDDPAGRQECNGNKMILQTYDVCHIVYQLSPPIITMPMMPLPVRPIIIPVIPSRAIVPVVMLDRIGSHSNWNRRWAIRRIIVTPCSTQHAETQEGE